ncbi:MAG: CapA family protein [Clostridiales bacterium]|nr:CapA family protein [Clostridiales bacterium]
MTYKRLPGNPIHIIRRAGLLLIAVSLLLTGCASVNGADNNSYAGNKKSENLDLYYKNGKIDWESMDSEAMSEARRREIEANERLIEKYPSITGTTADDPHAPETLPDGDIPDDEYDNPSVEEISEPEENEIVISFIGDVMLAAENGYDGFWSFNLFAYETPPSYYFEKMQDIFANDDLTVANCENVFTDNALAKQLKQGDVTYYYYSGTENARIYAEGSIEVASLANNHSMDYGEAGLRDTVNALESVGVMAPKERETLEFGFDGFKIGMFFTSLYSNYYLGYILDWLNSTAEIYDYHIVYYHGGTERVYQPDEWRVRASHSMIDAGADLVLGNHPHVLQPMEVYNGKTIIHSLGNFLFGGSHTCENRTIVYQLTLTLSGDELIGTSGEIIPCYCYGELWQPCVIPEGEERDRVLAFMNGEADSPL